MLVILIKLISISYIIYTLLDDLIQLSKKKSDTKYTKINNLSNDLNKMIEHDLNNMNQYIKNFINNVEIQLTNYQCYGFDASLTLDGIINCSKANIELNIFSLMRKETLIKLFSELSITSTIGIEFKSLILSLSDETLNDIQKFIIHHELSHYFNKLDLYSTTFVYYAIRIVLLYAIIIDSLFLIYLPLILLYPYIVMCKQLEKSADLNAVKRLNDKNGALSYFDFIINYGKLLKYNTRLNNLLHDSQGNYRLDITHPNKNERLKYVQNIKFN